MGSSDLRCRRLPNLLFFFSALPSPLHIRSLRSCDGGIKPHKSSYNIWYVITIATEHSFAYGSWDTPWICIDSQSTRSFRGSRKRGIKCGADRLMGSRWHCNSFEIKQNSTQSKEKPTTFVAYLAVKWKYIMCCRRLLCTLHTYTHSSDLFPFKLKSNLWVRSFLGSCVHIVSI